MIIFLDLDGTVRATKTGRPCPNRRGEQYILPHVPSKLLWEQNRENKLVGISNQAGVALGYLSEGTAHDLVQETNRFLGGAFSDFLLDFRDPGNKADLIRDYRWDTGIFGTCEKCLLVGNEFSDQKAAREVGINFEWAHDFFDWPEGYIEETERGYFPKDWLVKWREFKLVKWREFKNG